MMESKEYFILTKDEKGGWVSYQSEKFRLNEDDMVNLIRVCLIERRFISCGNRLLEIYKDSTNYRIGLTIEKLKKIGINDNERPKRTKKINFR